jgi:tRNA nucleotidyltransferase (CCA-adding enzyme)
MNIILTHEQADFDAIAALLAASLIQGSDIPVLPRKMNRNVHSFLTLYADELPFVEVRDLPAEEISQITLVDTQALVTLKGTTRKTQVSVIDHHHQKESIDPSWSMKLEQVGATTTILTEIIQDQNIPLNPTQANLLLLGIYEDTGSLSYISTTARDIRSAAYLMEQGASLKIATNYLNSPLSDEQKVVYDQLLANAQTEIIHGQRIIISTAEATSLVEEISSIAHKMRDLLEPDGLVIVVSTEEGYRLVFRSTTDMINVAPIAAHFGGGGHERAAAALVRRSSGFGYTKDEEELRRINIELINTLSANIHPPLTVKQIMSRKPRLIPPTISASDALKLMQKYGYEGFPVVDKNKVIGLLTRRSVDRALAHKLNLNASSLMEAGNVSVTPTDSIDHLHSVMTEKGWGQVPVFDPDKDEIVGIVTRTDLLKTLSAQKPRQLSLHLAAKLEAALPPERLHLLKAVAEQAALHQMAIYIVGGFVRDLILDRPGLDFDMVVEGDAISLAKSLVESFGGRLICHTRFGTAKWYLDRSSTKLTSLIPSPNKTPINNRNFPVSLDLITARTEFYDHPTALPTVERSSIKLDLHRRDFTINTMAVRLDGRHYGELLDHWGGYSDLKKGIIRVLHSLSFIDDPTRVIRAVRFEQRFQFKIEERTRELMIEAASQLRTITGERIRHELDLVFLEEKAGKILQRLEELDQLSSIYPALHWQKVDSDLLAKVLTEPIPMEWEMSDKLWGHPLRRVLGYTFWLMNLQEAEIRSVTHRLRIPGNIEKVILQARWLSNKINTLTHMLPSEITELLDGINPAAIFCTYSRSIETAERQVIEKYISRWRKIQPGIDGGYLTSLGLPPGPLYKILLEQLKGGWLDGKIHNSSEEMEYLKKIIDNSAIENGSTR